MESNWRFNVWDRGLIDSGARLCARVLAYTSGTVYLTTPTIFPAFGDLWDTVPGQAPVRFGSWTVAGRSFPYGLEVAPD